jgi:putative membrane protein
MIVQQKNWIQLILTIRGSALSSIIWRVLLVTSVAAAVTLLHLEYEVFEVSMTPLPFTLIGLALSIFLGFRNNTSYDRFWEGRKLWGRMVNVSRSLTRQLLTLVNSPSTADESERKETSATQHELVYHVMGYVHAFRQHLRNQWQPNELEPFFSASELESLEIEKNRPVAILQLIGNKLQTLYQKGHIHAYHLPVLEQSLTEMTTVQGACERIKSTPIPFSYTVLIHRIVAFYCFALPFGIADKVGLLTPLVVAFVSYAFFGLDAIGDEIEEPFGLHTNDLPLSALSTMIEVNLRQRLGETELPALHQPTKHGLLQ